MNIRFTLILGHCIAELTPKAMMWARRARDLQGSSSMHTWDLEFVLDLVIVLAYCTDYLLGDCLWNRPKVC